MVYALVSVESIDCIPALEAVMNEDCKRPLRLFRVFKD